MESIIIYIVDGIRLGLQIVIGVGVATFVTLLMITIGVMARRLWGFWRAYRSVDPSKRRQWLSERLLWGEARRDR